MSQDANNTLTLSLSEFKFTGWDIPIYYADGRIGHCDEYVKKLIEDGTVNFGATLHPQTEGQFEMATGSPRGRKPKQATAALALSQALTFVKTAFHSGSELPHQTHSILHGGFAVANDGQIIAGHPIEEESLSCAPRTDLLLNAINKAGKTLALAQLPTGRLSVKGEKLNALVPCIDPSTLPASAPDPMVAPLDDRIRKGFAAIGGLTSEAGTEVLSAAILLQDQTMIAAGMTGSACAMLVEYYHGNVLPPNLVIPKRFVAAVLKHTAKIVGAGATFDAEGRARTFTIHFEGGSWLKTLTYQDKYPDTTRFFDPNERPTHPVPTPAGLMEAIQAVYPFGECDDVYFKEGVVQSHATAGEGAQYTVEGLPGGKRFDGELFKKVGSYISQIDLTTYPDRLYFYGGTDGEMVRGCIMAMFSNQPQEQAAAAQSWQAPPAQAWEQATPVQSEQPVVSTWSPDDPSAQAQQLEAQGNFQIIEAEPEPEPATEPAPAPTYIPWT